MFDMKGHCARYRCLQIAGRARKLMRRLGMWAAGYDCAIILIGHLNKKEGSKGLYCSLGSIDVVAAARSVLQVERDTETEWTQWPPLRHMAMFALGVALAKRLTDNGRETMRDIGIELRHRLKPANRLHGDRKQAEHGHDHDLDRKSVV